MNDTVFFKLAKQSQNPESVIDDATNEMFDRLYQDIKDNNPGLARYKTLKDGPVPCSNLYFKFPGDYTAVLIVSNAFGEKPVVPLSHLQDEFTQGLKNFMRLANAKPYTDEDIGKLTINDIITAGKGRGVEFVGWSVRDNTMLNHFLDRELKEQTDYLVTAGFTTPMHMLHVLVERDNKKGVLGILKRQQIPVGIIDQLNRNPLFYCKSKDTFDLLCLAGANPALTIRDTFDEPAIHYYKNQPADAGAAPRDPQLYAYAMQKIGLDPKTTILPGPVVGYVMRPLSITLTHKVSRIENG